MARHAEGWRIFRRPGHDVYSVRFRVNGARAERSTGERDPEQAAKSAARIYADAVQRAPVVVAAARRGTAPPLDELIASWLATDTTIAAKTAKVWESYGRHWLNHFPTMADVTDVRATDYRNARLAKVRATTVRKELGAFRKFLSWSHERGYLPRVVKVPGVPSRVTGTAHPTRRRTEAPDLSPAEIEGVIEALPLWSTSKRVAVFAIRPRYRLQYETGLRPSTIDRLRVPQHWTPGSPVLNITPEIDKTRNARQVPLSPAARAALELAATRLPEDGLLFGSHNCIEHVRAAALVALPASKSAVFTGAHTRSARLTHWLEQSGNIAGAQYLAGHLDTRSTSRYLRPSFRAASALLDGFGGHSENTGDESKRGTKNEAPESVENTGA